MLIVCPNCATSYDVDVASLRPDGRRVRCVRCRSVWHAELPHKEKVIAAAEALAPVRRAIEAVAEATAEAAGSVEETPAEQFDVGLSDEGEPPAEAPALNAFVDSLPADPAESADSAADVSSVEVESPPIAPADAENDQSPVDVDAELQPVASAEPVEDIETIAARRFSRRAKRKRWQWPLSGLQSAIVALIVADAIVVGWRADFVRALPQTESFYALLGLPVNLRGLDFDRLATTTEQHEGVPILVIGGNIVNATSANEAVPNLRFAVRNAARQEIYSWTAVPPRTVLPPGEAAAFHTRLASPPPDAHDVLIRFVNRNDMLTGAR
jgi:predicted Zn finger-like uncharacterized protein